MSGFITLALGAANPTGLCWNGAARLPELHDSWKSKSKARKGRQPASMFHVEHSRRQWPPQANHDSATKRAEKNVSRGTSSSSNTVASMQEGAELDQADEHLGNLKHPTAVRSHNQPMHAPHSLGTLVLNTIMFHVKQTDPLRHTQNDAAPRT